MYKNQPADALLVRKIANGFLSSKYDITQHPNYKYTSDGNPQYAFNIEKYLSPHLKLRADEAYSVYEVDVNETEDKEHE